MLEAIAEGLHHGDQAEVEVLPVDRVGARGLEGVDLLVVGGPTHMHGMTSSMSRKLAVKAAEDEGLEVEPGAAEDLGLRTWLRDQAGDGTRAAAFDTVRTPRPRSREWRRGSPSGCAARFETVSEPESFRRESEVHWPPASSTALGGGARFWPPRPARASAGNPPRPAREHESDRVEAAGARGVKGVATVHTQDKANSPGSVAGAGITRRRLVQYGAGAGAGLLMWQLSGARGWAKARSVVCDLRAPLTAQDVLDPLSIPKYVTPLVIPPAMPLLKPSRQAARGHRLLRDRGARVRPAHPAGKHGTGPDDRLELRVGQPPRDV